MRSDALLSQLSTGGPATDVREVADRVLAAGDGTPGRVVAIMVASVDGRTAVEGRSAPLGHPADRALMRELRSRADVLLVGSKTVAVEGYADLLDDEPRERRLQRGQSALLETAMISRTMNLPLSAGLFQTPGARVRVFTNAEQGDRGDGPSAVPAEITVDVVGGETPIVQVAVDRLGSLGGGLIVCEGGPTLLGLLADANLIDDLLLTVAPVLVGDGRTLIDGPSLAVPLQLALVDVYRADQHLFLHYRRHQGADER